MRARINAFAVVFLFVTALITAGCATAKGVSCGLAEDTQAAAKGAAAGGYGIWQGILAADKWFKDNMW